MWVVEKFMRFLALLGAVSCVLMVSISYTGMTGGKTLFKHHVIARSTPVAEIPGTEDEVSLRRMQATEDARHSSLTVSSRK